MRAAGKLLPVILLAAAAVGALWLATRWLLPALAPFLAAFSTRSRNSSSFGTFGKSDIFISSI